MHNNLVTVNGQKMGKSLGNFINLNEVFSGSHALLERAYSPMTVRFYMLQAHYRSTLDLSNEALQAAEKGYKRLMNAIAETRKLKPAAEDTFNVSEWENRIIAALNDDLNTAVAIAELFEGARLVFTLAQGTDRLTADSLEQFRQAMHYWPTEVLGLTPEAEALNEKLDATVQLLIELRLAARRDKNFALSDEIRDRLKASGILLRDTPEGTSWALGE
jgi:cysteinyl-tRNA synthetase